MVDFCYLFPGNIADMMLVNAVGKLCSGQHQAKDSRVLGTGKAGVLTRLCCFESHDLT
jgi:hypothetical protein